MSDKLSPKDVIKASEEVSNRFSRNLEDEPFVPFVYQVGGLTKDKHSLATSRESFESLDSGYVSPPVVPTVASAKTAQITRTPQPSPPPLLKLRPAPLSPMRSPTLPSRPFIFPQNTGYRSRTGTFDSMDYILSETSPVLHQRKKFIMDRMKEDTLDPKKEMLLLEVKKDIIRKEMRSAENPCKAPTAKTPARREFSRASMYKSAECSLPSVVQTANLISKLRNRISPSAAHAERLNARSHSTLPSNMPLCRGKMHRDYSKCDLLFCNEDTHVVHTNKKKACDAASVNQIRTLQNILQVLDEQDSMFEERNSGKLHYKMALMHAEGGGLIEGGLKHHTDSAIKNYKLCLNVVRRNTPINAPSNDRQEDCAEASEKTNV